MKDSSQNEKSDEGKLIVEYKKNLYDLTRFMKNHPGGVNSLVGYNRKDIEEKFKKVEHSSAAEYLLNEYKLKKHELEKDSYIFDESLEHLINWNEALLPQISKLGGAYSEWVNKPVDRPMKLFSNPLMESLTKTPWFLPPLVWIPIVSYLIFIETSRLSTITNKSLIFIVIGNLSGGVVLWTLIEYTLHRFLFHMNVGKSPKWSTFHFLLHGLHHKVPFDENHLVFPPVPAAVLTTILYQPVHLVNSLFGGYLYHSKLVLSGGIIGYVCYDMIHFYIHHGSPKNKYFYHLKRYHYNHHFINQDKGFGISSPVWDFVFGTRIILKKLKYLLKW